MKTLSGRVVSVHSGSNDDLSKEEHSSIQVELDGIVGDRHRSYVRKTWAGDKQPEGTTRRNERQWSAVSIEELDDIAKDKGVDYLAVACPICLQMLDDGVKARDYDIEVKDIAQIVMEGL